jgi:predicted PurR-regulated permease PerM
MKSRITTPPWAMFLVAVACVVAVWILAQTIGQVLIVFAFSAVIALMLHPAVRVLRRWHVPRGIAVAVVFLGLLAIIIGVIALVVAPVRSQVQEIQQNLPTYSAQATQQIDRLQAFFNAHHIHINVHHRLTAFVNSTQQQARHAANNVLGYSLGVLGAIVTLLIILVASVYMALDAPRILQWVQRLGGPGAASFLRRAETNLMHYLRTQALVSLIISLAVGIALWILGVSGVYPLGLTFAVTFMTWVFLTDFVPYIGPILGAIPPIALALVTSLVGAIWVLVAFILIHETVRRLVPKALGDAAGVPPLVVIFGLLIGAQLAGVIGVVLAIPLVVIAKEGVSVWADIAEARRAERAQMSNIRAPEPESLPKGE